MLILLGLAVLAAGLAFSARGRGKRQAVVTHSRGSDLGHRVANFTLPDLQGKPVALGDFSDAPAVVLVFTGIDCPIGNLYLPRLVELANRYQERAVKFLAINANAHETVDQIAAHAAEHKLPFPTLKDTDNHLADTLRIDRVGEVLVLDLERRLRYRGAVDDQYVRGAYKPEPTHAYLNDALTAVLAGQAVPTPLTPVVSCPIERVQPQKTRRPAAPGPEAVARLRRRPSPEPVEVGTVTFSREIAPLMREKCQVCHRPGEAGPFSLTTFEDARRHGAAIRDVIDQGLMPPWGADPRHGTFANDRSLTDRERASLLAWIDQGMPAGELDQELPRLPSHQGWTIGEPDLVFEMPEPFDVPPSGQVPIQKFLVPTNLSEDVWVQAAQAMPGDRAVVHHICVFIHDPASPATHGKKDWETRRLERPELVCYAPGDMPCIYPEGIAKKLPAGSVLEIQVHYQPVGAARFDRSSVGIKLARQPVRKMAVSRSASFRDLVLPPDAANVEVKASYTLLEAGQLLSLTPHMHYRGQDFQFEAVYPDGRREVLLRVPHYDFDWQDVYRLAQPRSLPKRTRIECVAHFDNSAANPVNPDPTQTVTWGEQSTDEMMIGYFDYCVDLNDNKETPE